MAKQCPCSNGPPPYSNSKLFINGARSPKDGTRRSPIVNNLCRKVFTLFRDGEKKAVMAYEYNRQALEAYREPFEAMTALIPQRITQDEDALKALAIRHLAE